MPIKHLVVLLWLFSSLSCSTTPLPKGTDDPFLSEAAWKIQPGARISVVVQGEPSFSIEDAPVDSEGMVHYPILGAIRVSQYTPEQLKSYLTNRLDKDYFYNPKVSVTVSHSAKIFVLGEVKNPGFIEIEKPMTVLEAIQQAGSFSDQAQRDVVKVVRQTPKGEKIKTIYLKKLDFSWIKNENIYVMPGDLIMVN